MGIDLGLQSSDLAFAKQVLFLNNLIHQAPDFLNHGVKGFAQFPDFVSALFRCADGKSAVFHPAHQGLQPADGARHKPGHLNGNKEGKQDGKQNHNSDKHPHFLAGCKSLRHTCHTDNFPIGKIHRANVDRIFRSIPLNGIAPVLPLSGQIQVFTVHL